MEITVEQADAALIAAQSAEADAVEWAEAVTARVAAAKAAVATAKAELVAAKTAELNAKTAMRTARSARLAANDVVKQLANSAHALIQGADRWVAINDPFVLAARPCRRWSTALDSRVCSECTAMHGVVWRVDNRAFAEVAPPRAFGCRCSLNVLGEDDIVIHGWSVSDAPPAGFSIAPGYGVPGIERVLRLLKEDEKG